MEWGAVAGLSIQGPDQEFHVPRSQAHVLLHLRLLRPSQIREPPGEDPGAVVEVELVVGAAVEVEQPHRAQGVGVALEQLQRIMLEPARPHAVSELAGHEVARQVDAERCGRGVGAMRGN